MAVAIRNLGLFVGGGIIGLFLGDECLSKASDFFWESELTSPGSGHQNETNSAQQIEIEIEQPVQNFCLFNGGGALSKMERIMEQWNEGSS